ncbi:MAG: PD40 domain-containing protein [Deltaproteobacteria bacterium]|nr:PD40 domain-containing protein [Deltaproteobacteria bacterium]
MICVARTVLLCALLCPILCALLACRPSTPPASAPAEAKIFVGVPERLTSDQGCEEFPSFTPDGQTIVYDHTIDHGFGIFAIDLKTRTPRRLSMQSDTVWDFWERWDYAPVLSPDGRRIAHLRDDPGGTELRIMPAEGDAHGDPRRLGTVADAEPIWLGPSTLAALGQNNVILEIDADTGVQRPLTTIADAYEVYGFIALTDGALAIRIARADSSMRQFSLAIWRPGARAVELLPLTGGDVEPLRFKGGLASKTRGGIYQTRGNRLDDATLIYRPRDGGPGEVVATIPATMGIAIASDRTRLVYSACYEYSAIARIERGKPIEELAPRTTDIVLDVAPYADARVAFTAVGAEASDVRALDLSTGAVTSVALGNAGEARFFAPEKTVAFVRYDGQRGTGIAVRSHDGRELSLTANKEDNAPMFAHDGKHVVFLRGASVGDGAVLHRVAAQAGAKAEPLGVAMVTAFAASPTTDAIVFATVEEPTLFLTTLAGKTPRPLLASGGKGSFQAIAFSPDGKRIAVIRGQKELLEVPLAGAADPTLIADAGYFGLRSLIYAPDGHGFIAALRIWDGDLWIADAWLP